MLLSRVLSWRQHRAALEEQENQSISDQEKYREKETKKKDLVFCSKLENKEIRLKHPYCSLWENSFKDLQV